MKKNLILTIAILLVAAVSLPLLVTTAQASTPAPAQSIFVDGVLTIYSAPGGLRVANNGQGGVAFYCPCAAPVNTIAEDEEAFLKIFEDREMALYLDTEYGVYVAVNYTDGGVDTACACVGCSDDGTAVTDPTNGAPVPTDPVPTATPPTPTAVPTDPAPTSTPDSYPCTPFGPNHGEERPHGPYICGGE